MGLLFIANKLQQNPLQRRGLLKCSLQYTEAGKDRKEIPDREQAGRMLLLLDDYDRNIKNIKSDVELVNFAASLFVRYLEPVKLAWLMFDPVTDCYVPWIAYGFNDKTRKRMLFSPDKIKKMITTTVLMEIPRDKNVFFLDAFDTDDQEAVQNIVIIPLCYLDTLPGFILIVDLKKEYTTNTRFNNLFMNSPPVQAILGERFNKISGISKYNVQTREELTERMEKELEYSVKHNTVFNILKLQLESVIAPVIAEDPKLNALIVMEDILLLLGQLFKHIGFVYNMKNGTFLFIFNKLRKLDLALLKDQLSKAMKFFFAEITKTSNFDLDFQVYTYPGDGKTIQDMLSVIL